MEAKGYINTIILVLILVAVLWNAYTDVKKTNDIYIQYTPKQIGSALDTLKKYEKDTFVVRNVSDALREISRYNSEARN